MACRRHTYPDKPHHTCNNSICDLALQGVVAKLQSQATIDDGQSDDGTAPPNVRDSPDGAPVLSLVEVVMEEAQRGLEEEESDDDNANDGVTVAGEELYESGSISRCSLYRPNDK